jgi:8'-apo-carotenoid 13,14-cleaving dioxygenase
MACCADHWFLTDNDPPVPDETSITGLPVTGTLPTALSGTYLVIGSNPIGPPEAGEPARAAAMVHAITLDADGTVSYRNRWITTDTAARALGREPVPGPRRADNDGVASNIFTFGSTILAVGNDTLAYELTADLATRRRVDLAGAGRSMRPRVDIDRHSGALHLVGGGPGNAQTYLTVSAGAMTRATRPLDDAPRVEDLTITRDHVVFLADGLIGVTPRSALHESPVMWSPIDGGARRLAGAHDDLGGVVAHTAGPALERWTLHQRSTTVEQQIVDDTPLTFPNRNPGRRTYPHRYLWTCSAHSVHRHDLITGQRATHPLGPDHRPAEFRFVTDPARTGSEDGGWLVGVIHDRTHATADLVVLDSHRFDDPPIATVHIPRPVPNGTHAAWVPVNH